MSADETSKRIAKDAARELVSTGFPEYLPYFENLWEAKDDPKKLSRTRGFESLIVTNITTLIFPFVVTLATRVVTDYVATKVKQKDGMENTIKIVLEDAKKKHPEVSSEILKDLQKVLPRIVEKHIADASAH